MRISTLLILGIALPAAAAEPCVSGLQPGQRPGPYSFLVAAGPERGQQTCYVCAHAEKPAVIVFARKLSDPLGKLLVKLDDWTLAQPKDATKAWLTVLGEKTVTLDDLARWSKHAGVRSAPVGVFDDPIGPPAYKLADEAEVTVLLYVDRKVVANFAFRAGELNEAAVQKITDTLPKLTSKK